MLNLLPASFLLAWRRKKTGSEENRVSGFLYTFLLVNIIAYLFYKIVFRKGPFELLSWKINILYLLISCAFAYLLPLTEKYFKTVHVKADQWLFILSCILSAVLFLFHFHRIFNQNLWWDETYSVSLARMDSVSLVITTAYDVHPPLYYLFLKLTILLFQDAAWAYRLCSVIPYGLFLLFSLTAFRKEFGNQASLLLILFSSLLSTSFTYIIQIRMYEWCMLFVAIAYFELYKLLKVQDTRHALLLSLFSLSAAYTHYYGLLVIAFLYICLIVYALRHRKAIGKQVLLSSVVSIACYLPWMAVLLRTLGSVSSQSFWMSEIPSLKECLQFFFGYEFDLFLIAACLIIMALAAGSMISSRWENGQIRVYPERKQLDKTTVWMLSGFFAVLASVLVSIIASHAVHPMLRLGNLYPLTGIMWMEASVAVTRLKSGKMYFIALCLYLLLNEGSFTVSSFREEQMHSHRTDSTIAFIENHFASEKTHIITTCANIQGKEAEYYFPDRKVEYVSPQDISQYDFAEGETYWILWDEREGQEPSMELKPELKDAELGENPLTLYSYEIN